MQFRISIIPHTLQFRFDARTSRGAVSEHHVYFLKIWSLYDPSIYGVGECAPLAGLSIDHTPALQNKLLEVTQKINSGEVKLKFEGALPDELELCNWPSLCFALETALLDLKCGGRRILYRNSFSKGEKGIPINGLIWMGDKSFMQEQIKAKLSEGYNCIKLKIGSLNFESELDLLQMIRETAQVDDLTIRVDANGAFNVEDVSRKLERLAKYNIHSIEQPIRKGQTEQLAQLCANSPIHIALDEELIGISNSEGREKLIQDIKPHYIILKPTLTGGFQASADWIRLAENNQVGWWLTSALESNIGLNAISQFSANYTTNMPQGLGTGQLYHNNLGSPLTIKKGKLWYNRNKEWEQPEGLPLFNLQNSF